MSTALAIAGVTAVLRDLLNDGLDQPQRERRARQQRSRSACCRRIASCRPAAREASQLNLFLYQVTPNAGLAQRGPALARRVRAAAPRATRRSRSTCTTCCRAYSGGDLHAEILLGYAMQLLHETPVLTREAIRTALQPVARRRHRRCRRRCARSPIRASRTRSSRSSSRREYLNTEEMSKLWTAMQSHYRPTAAYMALGGADRGDRSRRARRCRC